MTWAALLSSVERISTGLRQASLLDGKEAGDDRGSVRPGASQALVGVVGGDAC